MKQWLLMMLISITLLGCSSEPQPKVDFYLLPQHLTSSPVTPTTSFTALASTLLIVQPVELAPYLDTAGIIYRQSATQVTQAKYHQWAQRLSPQLTERIIEQLRRDQPVSYWPEAFNAHYAQQKHHTLQVKFQRFNGAYTGNAELAGSWELLSPQGVRLLRQDFSFDVPLTDEGYPALVEALSLGLEQLTTQIKQTLLQQSLPNN
ncbi:MULTISPECIES: PqiC family protein [Vibrio]|uniref:ABC-type transport auxiliary lipoprotein family protein n=1 Tax=Vibrio chanodichtyis TaxID=3027932 RepID=A0ABT5V043_9VIBR|nr:MULTISPECIES: ABC-type transport auxiliary lipoprotein family protein [Vibrio]MDE1513690.1 ABC-type transport auxiliary lipoprotein family protein [Vibrio chanodichtyis]